MVLGGFKSFHVLVTTKIPSPYMNYIIEVQKVNITFFLI